MGRTRDTGELICKHCGAPLHMDPSEKMTVCPFCNTQYETRTLIAHTEKLEEEKRQVEENLKNAEEGQRKIREKLQKKKADGSAAERKREAQKFKKSPAFILMAVFAGVCFLVGLYVFTAFSPVAGGIGMGQGILMVLAILIRCNRLQLSKKTASVFTGISLLGIGLFLFAVIVYTETTPEHYKSARMISPEMLEMKEEIPDFPQTKGYIHVNQAENVQFSLFDQEWKDFQLLRNRFQKQGFQLDITESKNLYSAYNEEKYYLSLNYSPVLHEISAELQSPEEMTMTQWPEDTLAQILPVYGDFHMGKMMYENDKSLYMLVDEVTREQYDAYCRLLQEKGFHTNMENSRNGTFSGKNAQGYEVLTFYMEIGQIRLYIYAPEPQS